MKKLAIIFILSATFCCNQVFANYEKKGDIKVTLYGDGGIVVKPDGTQHVCPISSNKLCSTVTIPQKSYNHEKKKVITPCQATIEIDYKIVTVTILEVGNENQGCIFKLNE